MMNNNLLLISFNARYTHSNPALYSLRTAVGDLPYETRIHEFTIHDDVFNVLDVMLQKSPQVIGISVYIWNTMYVRMLLPEIRKLLADVKIVLGGPEVSFNADSWLNEFPAIDYIVCGAGEAGFRFLAECNFNHPEKIIQIPNQNFASLPFPYRKEDCGNLRNKYVYYEASRGCPFHCSYCLSSRDDQPLEFRDIETVKQEIRKLWEFEPFIIKFIDRSFNVNREFAREIWCFILKESPDIMYHFEIHPLYLEDEDFEIFRQVPVGRFQFEIGIQSIHAGTLREIGRTGTWDEIKPNLMKLRQFHQIHQHYDAIVGLPGEGKTMLGQTVSELLTLHPDHLQLGFLKVLPGTIMTEKVHEYGMQYQGTPPYRILFNKWISFTEIQSCEKLEAVLNNYITAGHFTSVINQVFDLENGKGFEKLELLVEHIRDIGADLNTKDWLKKAKILQSFYTRYQQDNKNMLDELLLWDWMIFPSNLPYPKFLPLHLLQEAKEILLSHLHNLPSTDGFWKEHSLHPDDIRRAHFFKSEREEVQKQVLNGRQYAMIWKQQGMVRTITFDI
ncbi:MAG TPA: DUF4080 domain-containing protein [Candidatus Cloacimonadota bacterium]|nr:DUF4080 domain-containing protein [Candidatus Cloacimonadota bacterium]